MPLLPPSPSLSWPGLKIWKDGVHAVKKMTHYAFWAILVGKTHAISVFFSGEKQKLFLAADELRSHVTITLRHKSRYDLIVKINEKAYLQLAG